MDRDELLNNIREGREELQSALDQFDKRHMADTVLANGWSVKDVIAHIGFWENRMVNLYSILSSGDVPQETIDSLGLDDLNARVYEDNQLVPLGIVQINELEAYEKLLDIAETAPADDLFDPQRFAWTEGEPFYKWIEGNTYGHYADHIPELIEVGARL